jgi:spore coat protein U-like protein
MRPLPPDSATDAFTTLLADAAARRRLKQTCVLLALFFGTASGAHAACTFRTAPGAITFTAFDPSVASTQTASTTARVNCTAGGSPTWSFSGVNGSAPLRMKHASLSVYIPYSVSATYVSGGATNQLFNITATVLGTNYQNANVGSYSDLLTITITP